MAKKDKLILIAFPIGTTQEELAEVVSSILNKTKDLEIRGIKDSFNVSVGTVEEFADLVPISDFEIGAINIAEIVETANGVKITDLPEVVIESTLLKVIFGLDKKLGNVFDDNILRTYANADRREQKVLAGMGLGMLPRVASLALAARK